MVSCPDLTGYASKSLYTLSLSKTWWSNNTIGHYSNKASINSPSAMIVTVKAPQASLQPQT